MIFGVVVAAGVLLVLAGIAKVGRPSVAADAIRAADLPGARTSAVTALGAVELLLGALVIVWPTRWLAALVALVYLGFALFSLRLLSRKGGNASCGCFGQSNAPLGVEHVVVNLVVVACGVAAALGAGQNPTNPAAIIIAGIVLLIGLVVVPTLRVARR